MTGVQTCALPISARHFSTATDDSASSESSKGEPQLMTDSAVIVVDRRSERLSNATLFNEFRSGRKSSAVVKDVNESGGKSVKKEKMDLNPPKVRFLNLEP